MVWLVLEMVADNMDWDLIVREYHNSFPREAIAEAVKLARRAFDQVYNVPPAEM
jgi:uncharacterized protein (DUF433 family)